MAENQRRNDGNLKAAKEHEDDGRDGFSRVIYSLVTILSRGGQR